MRLAEAARVRCLPRLQRSLLGESGTRGAISKKSCAVLRIRRAAVGELPFTKGERKRVQTSTLLLKVRPKLVIGKRVPCFHRREMGTKGPLIARPGSQRELATWILLHKVKKALGKGQAAGTAASDSIRIGTPSVHGH